MEENRYFQEALAGFTHEAASGGAIRHLADRGYTVGQIVERLDFPTPVERVRREVWERLLDTGAILREEPGAGVRKEKASYVREYDRYGKVTFRRVVESEGNPADLAVERWTEREAVYRTPDAVRQRDPSQRRLSEDYGNVCKMADSGETKDVSAGGISVEELMELLKAKTKENGQELSYASWDFGLTAGAHPRRYQEMLTALGPARDYVEGLPWERRRMYHRLDARMTQALSLLAGAGLYHGECFFLKTKEKIRVTGVCNESE